MRRAVLIEGVKRNVLRLSDLLEEAKDAEEWGSEKALACRRTLKQVEAELHALREKEAKDDELLALSGVALCQLITRVR